MTSKDAKEVTEMIQRLFPALNDEQSMCWYETLRPHDRDTAERAAMRYYASIPPGGFPSIEGFRAHLRGAPRGTYQPIPGEQVAKIEDEWRAIDRAIEQTPDDELECWKAQALTDGAALKPGAVEFLRNANPRKSRTLRGLIYRAMRAAVGAAA